MTALFVLYNLFLCLAHIEASPFLSASVSRSFEGGTSTTLISSQTPSPTCFQPKASSGPPASQISSALTNASAVNYACSNTTAQHSSNNTIYYNAGAYSFNITLSGNGNPRSDLWESYCSQIFQTIIKICILQQNFWGGWTLIGHANWSISNSIYPQNLLPLPGPVEPSSTTIQFSRAQYRTTLSTANSLTPASTILSEDPSRLILAIENVVSDAQISLSAVATESPKSNGSMHSVSSRQSQNQLGAAFDPSASSTATSTGTSTTNPFGPVASIAPKTEQSKRSSPTTKPSSQMSQQEALKTSISLSASSSQTFGLPNPTTTSHLGSLVGGNDSVKTAPILGPLTIAPDYTITDAFRAGLSTTTVSASNGAVLVYSMQTFSDLANRTGTPILVQTTVPETLANGSLVTYSGGVWVASGGRYWFPPGIPKPESGGDLIPDDIIDPPCIEPFCSGKVTSNGGGGGDPKGDPPPPYEPPTPPPAYTPPANEGGEEPDQETQEGQTRTAEKGSQVPSQSAQRTTEQKLSPSSSSVSTVSRVTISSSSTQTFSTSTWSVSIISHVTLSPPSTLSSSSMSAVPTSSSSSSSASTFSRVTMSSSSVLSSSSMPAYGAADLFDGTFVDYNLSMADANAAALDALSLINAVTVANGILWAPTGSQELGYAAQATSSFDLALPTFANFTEAPSLSSSQDSMSSQTPTISTGSLLQTKYLSALSKSSAAAMTASANANANAEALGSEIAGLAVLAGQLASSSAAAAANEPPTSSTDPQAPTLPPSTIFPEVSLACTQ